MKFLDKYDTARPYTACFVILMKDDKIAMVLRKNTGWMDDHYGLPAGKLEYGETFTEGAIREAKEEAGVSINPENMRVVHVAHRHAEKGDEFMDWVDVYFSVDEWEGEPHNAEPKKSERLDWLYINDLPDSIVPSQRDALTELAKGNFYSEYGWSET
jgi:8-oxo-dGTP diphosphatase